MERKINIQFKGDGLTPDEEIEIRDMVRKMNRRRKRDGMPMLSYILDFGTEGSKSSPEPVEGEQGMAMPCGRQTGGNGKGKIGPMKLSVKSQSFMKVKESLEQISEIREEYAEAMEVDIEVTL